MEDLQRYRQAGQVTQYQERDNQEEQIAPDLFTPILRRWRVVVLVGILIVVPSVAAIWKMVKPRYQVTGAIRVAPILTNVLSGEADTGEISNYHSFMNTQAVMITSDQVVQRVADELGDKDLEVFEAKPSSLIGKLQYALNKPVSRPDAAKALKKAITSGKISAQTERGTELIMVTIKSSRPEEAKQVVDSFIRAYMAVEVSSTTREEAQKLNVLENERDYLEDKLKRQRQQIRQLAEEYGTTTLDGRQDMMLKRVATIQAKLTELETQRIHLETKVELLNESQKSQTIGPEQLLQMRNQYVNSDPTLGTLSKNLVEMEQEFTEMQQALAKSHPRLKQKQELIESFQDKIEVRKNAIGEEFDQMIAERMTQAAKDKLRETEIQLKQTKAFEQKFRDVLSEVDEKTISLGRKQLAIQDLEDQLQLTKEMHDRVNRRIQEFEMERKKPARVNVAYNADIASVKDSRMKYSLAAGFGAFVCGIGLGLLKDRSDRSLRNPGDIIHNTGLAIIGTTTKGRGRKAVRCRQVADDYETICTNLGLMNGEGIPQILLITSPGTREGKSTMSVNLATSMANMGRKVLLVDGDLRKPDISNLMHIQSRRNALKEYLKGKDFDKVIYSQSGTLLSIITAQSCPQENIYKLLTQIESSNFMKEARERFDHIIVDSPPVLAVPDALVWAKMVDAVVMTSFAERTEAQELNEAVKRFSRINVRLLGAILNNVTPNSSYYPYRYNYGYSTEPQRHRKYNRPEAILIPVENSESDDN